MLKNIMANIQTTTALDYDSNAQRATRHQLYLRLYCLGFVMRVEGDGASTAMIWDSATSIIRSHYVRALGIYS